MPEPVTVPTMSPTHAHYGHGHSTFLGVVLVMCALAVGTLFLLLYNIWDLIPEDCCIKRRLSLIGPVPDRRARYGDITRAANKCENNGAVVELETLHEETRDGTDGLDDVDMSQPTELEDPADPAEESDDTRVDSSLL